MAMSQVLDHSAEVNFYHEPAERSWDGIPPVAFVPLESGLSLDKLPEGMKVAELPGIGRFVCPDRWTVHKDPVPHKGSGALYIVNGEIIDDDVTHEQHAVFVYILPPGEETSKHIHVKSGSTNTPMTEEYFWLDGEVDIEGTPLDGWTVVPPYARHQVRNNSDKPAIVLAVLRNVSGIDPSEWHQHIEEQAPDSEISQRFPVRIAQALLHLVARD